MLKEHSFLLYFWLCWVFAALRVLLELGARRLLIAVASLLQSVGSRVWGLQYLQVHGLSCWGSQGLRTGHWVAVPELSCSATCGNLLH